MNSGGVEAGLGTMTAYFGHGGAGDLQRTYNGQAWDGTGGSFVPGFTDAASFNLGLVGAVQLGNGYGLRR